MRLTLAWTHGVPPAAATLSCSGETHRLLWRDGELRALDHDDPEAERALAALGGTSCACIETLDAWARHAADPRVLVLGPRGGERDFGAGGADGSMINRSRVTSNRGRGPNLVRTRAAAVQTAHFTYIDDEEGDPLGRLLALGGALPRRLVATVAAALADQTTNPELRAQLHAALFGRVLAGLTLWLGAAPRFELEMISDGAEPSLVRRDDLIHARLPFRWLIEVWARELTTVWGRFVLTAAPDPESEGFDLGCVDPALDITACRLAPR